MRYYSQTGEILLYISALKM